MEEAGRNITKVLVVDDEKLVLNTVRISLEQLDGFEVLSASSGKEGLELARSESPDIIILDIYLPPGISGTEVCRKLRSDPITAEIPILFLTGKYDVEAMEQTLELEAQAYILKPFSSGDLINKINEVLGLGI